MAGSLGCVHFDLGRDECAADGAVAHARATRPTNDQVAARHEEHVQPTVHADPAAFATQRSAAGHTGLQLHSEHRYVRTLEFHSCSPACLRPKYFLFIRTHPTPPFYHSPTLSNPLQPTRYSKLSDWNATRGVPAELLLERGRPRKVARHRNDGTVGVIAASRLRTARAARAARLLPKKARHARDHALHSCSHARVGTGPVRGVHTVVGNSSSVHAGAASKRL